MDICNVCGHDGNHYTQVSFKHHNRIVDRNRKELKNYQSLSPDEQTKVRARIMEDEDLPETTPLEEVEQAVLRVQASIK